MPVNVLTTNLKEQTCNTPQNLPYVQHNGEIFNVTDPPIQVHCGESPFALVSNQLSTVNDPCTSFTVITNQIIPKYKLDKMFRSLSIFKVAPST